MKVDQREVRVKNQQKDMETIVDIFKETEDLTKSKGPGLQKRKTQTRK